MHHYKVPKEAPQIDGVKVSLIIWKKIIVYLFSEST